MNKSEAALKLEAQIHAASHQVDECNKARGVVRLDHLAILEGQFEDQLSDSLEFLEARLEDILKARAAVWELQKRVTEGATKYYAEEMSELYV